MRDQGGLPGYGTDGFFPHWDYPPLTPGNNYGVPGRQPLDWSVRWPQRFAELFLRVQVGVSDYGDVVELDLKPPAHGGDWPHVLCAGPEGSGKSTFLRTVLVGLADGSSPDHVQFVLTGTHDEPMTWIPHLATDATSLADQPGRVRKLALALDTEIWRRRQLADLSGEPVLVLALDDVDRLIATEPGLLDVLARIGRDGEQLGMHLLLTATDTSGLDVLRCLPIPLNQGYGRLRDTGFAMVGITPDLLSRFASTFMCYRHPVRSLWSPPGDLTYERMSAHDPVDAPGIPVGVLADGELGALHIDFATRSHLLVHGEARRGKTTVLRTVLRGIAAQYRTPGAVVLDLDRIAPVVERIRGTLRRRVADRGLWHGPELFLVIDDYDKVPADADPLAPLADLLRHGSSIGVHLLATTATGFADRQPIQAVPAKDRTQIRLSSESRDWRSDTLHDRWIPHFRWDTWHNPTPVGRAEFAGERAGTVQIAIDTGTSEPQFRPLEEFLTLDAPDCEETSPEPPARPDMLTAVIGATDDGDPVHLDVRRHTWCGGDISMGKSTLLHRVALSLATRYPPATVQLLLADSHVPRLHDLAELPHTAWYLSASEPKDAHRLAALLDDEVRRRLAFEEQGILPEMPHLVVLVDTAGEFVVTAPAVGDALRRIAAWGTRLGISLVLAERDLVGQVLTGIHRMTENRVSFAYFAENSAARTLGLPPAPELHWTGRGRACFRAGAREARMFGVTAATPAEVRATKFRVTMPALRALPLSPPLGTFTYDELRYIVAAQRKEFRPVPIGLADGSEQPAGLDFERNPHLVIAGAPGSGRSTVLRTLLRGIAQRYTARDCAVLLLHDNMISGVLPDEYVLAASTGLQPPPEMINDVLSALRRRVEAPGWTGPRLFVAIDDHDLFATEHDPLTALREMIPHASRIGLHFLVTGGDDMFRRPEIAALGDPRLILSGGRPPAPTEGDVPALPEVGRGKLVPSNLRLRLPWSQQP